MKSYWVYIITNRRNGTLNVGVTNSLFRRIWEHRNKVVPGFSARYGLGILVYFAEYADVRDAIAAEKRIKGGSRKRKLALIEEENPRWNDLSAGWYC